MTININVAEALSQPLINNICGFLLLQTDFSIVGVYRLLTSHAVSLVILCMALLWGYSIYTKGREIKRKAYENEGEDDRSE